MFLHSVTLLFAFACATYGSEIIETKTEELAMEGSTVTLSCSYSSAVTLFWYRQHPRSAPQFLVNIIDGANKDKRSDVDPRFTAKLTKGNKKHVYLEISSVKVTDSALYYCALNQGFGKMTFGTGTKLTVNSKEEVPPSIYKVNETSCLATDFTRHDAVDSDPAFKDQNVAVRYKDEGTYSAFALGTGDQCKETGTCSVGSSNHQNAIESDEKMNFMSLGIFWLRILFVKTVVFNVLMTFKAWMG